MTDCPRLGRLFGGCKFSPRYDLGPPTLKDFNGVAAAVVRALEASKPKTYVRDICERCGKVVKR